MLTNLADAIATGTIRIIDLTQTLSDKTPMFVLPPEFKQGSAFKLEQLARYEGCDFYWNNFTVNEHTGTHFDAPVHWVTGKDLPKNAVDTIDLKAFIAPAVVIDVCDKTAANADYLLIIDDITAWEAKHGRIPPRSWVLMRTDWSKLPLDKYTNRREDGAHTPGPSIEVVRFLIDQRDALGFGVETIGTDAGQAHLSDPPYPAHRFFCGAGRYGLQCLANLDCLPATGAVIFAAPLKIKNGSGSPLRVLALVPA